PAETLARFRPAEDAQALRPTGRLSARPLLTLDFPWPLLDWPDAAHPNAPLYHAHVPDPPNAQHPTPKAPSDWWLWEWLALRFRATPETLPAFFGLTVAGQEALACEARAWQAALYYRFVHRRVGDGWWLAEVETWTRAYLPLARPTSLAKLRRALAEYQEILAAAGFLSLPMGYGRVNARIHAARRRRDAAPGPLSPHAHPRTLRDLRLISQGREFPPGRDVVKTGAHRP